VIILLNGTSSAGKTSIARELQRRLPEPYLHTGIDYFFRMLPPRYLGEAPPADERFLWLPPTNCDGGMAIQVGPVGQRMIAGYHRAVAALAAAGNHVIVDEVLLDPAWLRDWVEVLATSAALFVGVRCPLDVVEQRERERGDRAVGQARGHFAIVHVHGGYDVEIDTSRTDPAGCAEQIIEALATAPAVFGRI
jgi:chloramphenicol 3-O phosphotransferase